MTKEELKDRTKKFALNIVALVEDLARTKAGHTIGNQIIRSSTSVAANYRAACKARSVADFISKLTIVEEEADETCLWLELLLEGNIFNDRNRLNLLLKEANELTAIFTAAGKTTKMNNQKLKK
jgi:four helix bundle protein